MEFRDHAGSGDFPITALLTDWREGTFRSHFYGIATRIVSQILIQRAPARQAEKRGGDCDNLPLDDVGPISDGRAREII